MTKAILHIGPEKTGSTALQQALKATANPLRAKGWTYEPLLGMWNHAPLVPLFSGAVEGSHLADATGFSWAGEKAFRNMLINDIERLVSVTGNKPGGVILVNELLSSRLTERKSVSKIINFLLTYFDSITVTFAVKSQVNIVESIFSEELRWGAANLPDWGRLKGFHWLNFESLLNLWSGHSNRVSVEILLLQPETKVRSRTDIVQEFLGLVGVPELWQPREAALNVHSSIGARGAAILWAYNSLTKDVNWDDVGIDNPTAFRLRLFDVLRSAQNDRRLRLSPTEANDVLRFYWRGNLALSSLLSAESAEHFLSQVKPSLSSLERANSFHPMQWYRTYIDHYRHGEEGVGR